ncbi:M16 family metallopeptidase [Desulfitibacter alkalitolerans]|uniref:M16 family metallopeptidase n=1 Tax=Desulfitibacter alkalitolerans TaxID=264641 RepID=UPI00048464B2|nr:pitrilysin family protein [Desulfitibacter alkalitolerans]
MIKESLLKNGIRLVSEEMPYANSVSIGFWIKIGSRNEEQSLQGITHFIEHLLFKGTEKRTAKQIAEELEMVGGSLNAFTSREYTCIYARVLKDDIDLAVELLSDMMLNSCFGEEDIKKEKNVVCEEIMMYEDTPDEIIHDIFTQQVWYGHSLGRAILGTKETVSGYTRKEILNYYREFFVPKNIIISAAGNLNHERLKEKLSILLEKVGDEEIKKEAQSKPDFITVKHSKDKDIEQMHICLGTRGVHQKSEDLYSLMVFNNLLGGGISSKLFQSVREDMGLAYSIYSYLTVYSDAGLFVIYAGTAPKNTEKIINEMHRQIQSLNKKEISLAEMERSKNQLKGNILLNMEGVSHRMSRLGRTMITYDRIITAEEVINNITRVTLEDIYKLDEQLADLDKYSLITVGPKDISC